MISVLDVKHRTDEIDAEVRNNNRGSVDYVQVGERFFNVHSLDNAQDAEDSENFAMLIMIAIGRLPETEVVVYETDSSGLPLNSAEEGEDPRIVEIARLENTTDKFAGTQALVDALNTGK